MHSAAEGHAAGWKGGDLAGLTHCFAPLQHYAVKTIENLASKAGEWMDVLASADVAERLAAIWAGE